MKKYILLTFFIIFPLCTYGKLEAVSFPKTYSDLSFVGQMENMMDGYQPFLNKSAYQRLNIVPEEEVFIEHSIAVELAKKKEREEDFKKMTLSQYCEKHPEDEENCPEKTVELSQTPPLQTNFKNIGGGTVTEDNFVTGGSCYPPDRDTNFPNKILTTGKYENVSPAFEKGLITIFRKEGTCGTIKGDRCGYTCYGVGSKCIGVVVHSRPEAEEIYRERFWEKYEIYKLPDVISTDYFLAAMGTGPGTAYNMFRKFLGLPKTKAKEGYKIKPDMIRAVNNYKGDIHNDWLDRRETHLQKVADEYKRKYNTEIHKGYKNSIKIQRKNGCHVRPAKPVYRN